MTRLIATSTFDIVPGVIKAVPGICRNYNCGPQKVAQMDLASEANAGRYLSCLLLSSADRASPKPTCSSADSADRAKGERGWYTKCAHGTAEIM